MTARELNFKLEFLEKSPTCINCSYTRFCLYALDCTFEIDCTLLVLHGTSNIKSASHKHHMFSVSAAEYMYVICNFSLMGQSLCIRLFGLHYC